MKLSPKGYLVISSGTLVNEREHYDDATDALARIALLKRAFDSEFSTVVANCDVYDMDKDDSVTLSGEGFFQTAFIVAEPETFMDKLKIETKLVRASMEEYDAADNRDGAFEALESLETLINCTKDTRAHDAQIISSAKKLHGLTSELLSSAVSQLDEKTDYAYINGTLDRVIKAAEYLRTLCIDPATAPALPEYQAALFYGYEEGECGIYHSFELRDPEENWDDDEVAAHLAEQLDCNPNDYRFNHDSMYVKIPDSIVARIRKEVG